MVMTDNNLYFFNDHLFARKGEAAPAPIQEPNYGGEHFHGGAAKSVDSIAKGGHSSMSFLIQRHMKPAQDQAPVPVASQTAASFGKRQGTERGNQCRSWTPHTEVVTNLDVRRERAKSPRRQLTLRLSQEDFDSIKSLAEFAGIPYQKVLERAVKSYVHSAKETEFRSIGQG